MKDIKVIENINYIDWKTVDGRFVTLDGFRVESFTTYENDKGEECVDICFKSGQAVTVPSEHEEYDGYIPGILENCLDPEWGIMDVSQPVRRIECRTADGKEFVFDGNSVEFYITDRDNDDWDGTVELHFASGRTVVVFDAIDAEDEEEEYVEILLDDCICRYFND